ncbi:hypothetical protein AB0L70_15700 [Kribbella sp. NPDC051952]
MVGAVWSWGWGNYGQLSDCRCCYG